MDFKMKLNVNKIKCTFAIVDIQGKLRHKLAKHFDNTPPGATAQKYLIPITLYGYLDGTNSGDDGTSIEFTMQVDNVKASAPVEVAQTPQR